MLQHRNAERSVEIDSVVISAEFYVSPSVLTCSTTLPHAYRKHSLLASLFHTFSWKEGVEFGSLWLQDMAIPHAPARLWNHIPTFPCRLLPWSPSLFPQLLAQETPSLLAHMGVETHVYAQGLQAVEKLCQAQLPTLLARGAISPSLSLSHASWVVQNPAHHHVWVDPQKPLPRKKLRLPYLQKSYGSTQIPLILSAIAIGPNPFGHFTQKIRVSTTSLYALDLIPQVLQDVLRITAPKEKKTQRYIHLPSPWLTAYLQELDPSFLSLPAEYPSLGLMHALTQGIGKSIQFLDFSAFPHITWIEAIPMG